MTYSRGLWFLPFISREPEASSLCDRLLATRGSHFPVDPAD